MNEPQTKNIDGFEFTISQLPGMRGLKVFTRVVKVLGSGLAGALKAGGDSEAKALGLLGMLKDVDEADVEFLARELFSTAIVKRPGDDKTGQVWPVFDSLFQGRIDLLFKALVFALQVNYGDFMKGLGAGARAAAQAAASPSNSPTA